MLPSAMKLNSPDLRPLKKPLADAARGIASALAEAGHRAWLVGGAVRDLALGTAVGEIDMATDALPEVIEALFPNTIPVGKAFGTIIVVWQGQSVEVTTFRSERGYSDGRRPDAVEFGATPEEDARRRDFTCNALFLDPLSGELLDPEGGLPDLEAGILAAIGDAGERFREDGLRLLRAARFHARFDLELAPETRTAARAEAAAIERIAKERILHELQSMLTARRAHVALGVLEELGILGRALPGWSELHGSWLDPVEVRRRRLETLEWLESTHAPSGFAVLFEPFGAPRTAARAALEALRPAKELVREVQALWDLLDALEALWPLDESDPEQGPDRSSRLRILADPAWPRARDLAAAFGDARGLSADGEPLEGGHLGRNARELDAFAHTLSAGSIDPEPLLTSADLRARECAPGPAFGALLAEARELQLQAHLPDREAALAWLEGRLSSAG
jgi:tRNA nucleotidyltransferase/poly(A) polymerase